MERRRITERLDRTTQDLMAGADTLTGFMTLLGAPQELYRQAPDNVRRQLNSAFFERFYLEDQGVVGDEPTPVLRDFATAAQAFRAVRHIGGTAGKAAGVRSAPTANRRADRQHDSSPVRTDEAASGAVIGSLADLFSVGGST